MKRQDTVTMDGEEFDSIHTKLWCITDLVKASEEYQLEALLKRISEHAMSALNIMDREED